MLGRFLVTYVLRYRQWYLGGLAALVATNYLTVLIPSYIQRAIDALQVVGGAEEATRHARLILPAALGVMVVRTLSRVCFFNPGRAVEFNLKNHLFRHLMRLPAGALARYSVGDLISRSSNDLSYVRALVGFAGLQIFNVGIAMPMTLWKMAQMDRDLTLRVLLPMGVSLLLLWASVRALSLTMRRSLKELSDLSDGVLDTYNAVPVIQGYNAQPAFFARFDDRSNAYTQTQIQIALLRSFLLPSVHLFGNLGVVGVVWWGGQKVLRAELSVGTLAAFSSYIGLLVAQLMSFGWTLNSLQRGVLALRRVYELLDLPPIPPGRALPPPGPGRVELEVCGLGFAFGGAPVLEGLNFRVGTGQTLGVFGPTGSGKSTLLALLAGLYAPPPGTVRIRGEDLSTLDLDALREVLVLVPQDPYLFSRSLRDNIAWSPPPTSAQDPQRWLEEVTRAACLSSDVARLPQGLQTLVGARGVTLSGGQRQRTALARAFHRGFSILLLDDVLSAVDHKTERQLIENIQQVARGVTTIIVAHRISALRHAGQILVLEGGRQIDLGTHEELLTRCPLYERTWARQQEQGEEGGDG